jgi:hypothetical protein
MGSTSGRGWRFWVRAGAGFGAALWLLAACAVAIPASGIDLEVVGLPAETTAHVEIAYAGEVLATATESGFVELPPGVYTVAAARTEDLSHRPDDVGTVLVLTGKRTPVSVTYRPIRVATFVPFVGVGDALRPAIDALGAEHVRLDTVGELIDALATETADAFLVSIHDGPMDGALADALADAAAAGVRMAFFYWQDHPVWGSFGVNQVVPATPTGLGFATSGGFGADLPTVVAVANPGYATYALALGGLGIAWCQTEALAFCGLRLAGSRAIPFGFVSDAFADPAEGRRVFQNLARALFD